MSDDPGSYRLLDHTGDLAIVVRARTLEELFDAAARALFDVIVDVRTVEERESLPIRIEEAVDREDLFVRFLSELVFLHDARDWLFRAFRVRSLDEHSVEGEAVGERFEGSRHAVRRQVKAVTYHHALLSEDREGWSARVVLDL